MCVVCEREREKSLLEGSCENIGSEINALKGGTVSPEGLGLCLKVWRPWRDNDDLKVTPREREQSKLKFCELLL